MSEAAGAAGWRRAGCWLLVVLAAVMLFSVDDYGSSWDEALRARGGEQKLDYYARLLTGDLEGAAEIGRKGDNYPGFFDLNLALLRRVSPLHDTTTGHAFSALLGFLTVLGAMRLAGLVAGPRAAFWAGLLLVLAPRFYGHQFINPKDIPFACGYVWGLYWIARWLVEPAHPRWRVVVAAGLAVGVAMACRVGGMVLLCYLGLFLGLRWLANLRRGAAPGSGPLGWIRTEAVRALLAAGIAFVVLLVYWPAMQWKPFARAGGTLEATTHYAWNMPVLFEGSYLKAPDLPFYYLPKMFALTTPLPLLILALAALLIYPLRLARPGTREGASKAPAEGLLVFAVVFPLLYVVARDSTVYNGIRHLLFVLPPAAVLAGAAFARLTEWLREHRPHLVPLARGALAAALLWTAVAMVRLHPYQYIYYNELSGGVRGAAGAYETDYWCTAYRELAEGLLEHLEAAGAPVDGLTVNTEHVSWLLQPYLEDAGIAVVRSMPEADDFYLAVTQWQAHSYYHGRPVVEISRMGVPLGYVIDRRGLAPEERVMFYSPQKTSDETAD